MEKIKNSSAENAKILASVINPDLNFDIVRKKITIAERSAEFFFIDGFVKDDIMEKLMESFISIEPGQMPETAEKFLDLIPYVEVNRRDGFENVVNDVLMGMVCMFVDGFEVCFSIDCRTYPVRAVSEPWKNRVLRGSRDGFVETIVSNVALIRRRIRTPEFCVEMTSAGTKSKTDIAFAYIRGKCDEKLLSELKQRVAAIDVEALTMNLESLVEVLLPGPFINPFPKFKYSERPDTAAAAIYDGNIVLLIDNSPAVIIVPTSIFDIAEEADDYYFPPLVGNYIKITRFAISIVSLILTPLWVLLLKNPDSVPDVLRFVLIEDGGSTVPVVLQLMILEFCIDGLRLAAVNTPTLLSTPLSLIAGIVVGEYAVSSGWFDSETMLYMAFVTIGTYTQASYELGYTIKFFRMILVLLSGMFSVWGFAAGMLIFMLCMIFNKTISGKSYIYPLVPFDGKMLMRKLFRLRLGKEKPNE